MSGEPEPPVGRLAPSPTGLLHLGHARTFLLAWWHLRARGGRVLLRLEDLDAARVKPGMADACLADLEWLGIDWDGAPEVQSEGSARLGQAASDLAARGLAYACVCTRREVLEAASAPHGAGARYPGTCRGRFADGAAARRATGREPALRFVAPPGAVSFVDAFAGPFEGDPAAEVGDFPITSRDGRAAYQLAVVVDDARAGVSEVHRARDLLSSTCQQILLQRALELPHPRWLHFPLVTDETGRRLAKRADDLSLARLREEGADPRRVVAWVARSAGIELGARDLAAAPDLVPAFDLARVPAADVVLGPEDLARMR